MSTADCNPWSQYPGGVAPAGACAASDALGSCRNGECVVATVDDAVCDSFFLTQHGREGDYLPKCHKSMCAPGNPKASVSTGCVAIQQDQVCNEGHALNYYAWIQELDEAACLNLECASLSYEAPSLGGLGEWVLNPAVSDKDPIGCTAVPHGIDCPCGGDSTNRCDGLQRCVVDPNAKFGAVCNKTGVSPCPTFQCNPLVECHPPALDSADARRMAGMNNYAVECEYTKGGRFHEDDANLPLDQTPVPFGNEACQLIAENECVIAVCGESLSAMEYEQIASMKEWGATHADDCGCMTFELVNVKAGTRCEDVPWLLEIQPQLHTYSGSPCDQCVRNGPNDFTCTDNVVMPASHPSDPYPAEKQYVVSPYECKQPICTVNPDNDAFKLDRLRQPTMELLWNGHLYEQDIHEICSDLWSTDCGSATCDPEGYRVARVNNPQLAAALANNTKFEQMTQLGCYPTGSHTKCQLGASLCSSNKECAFDEFGMLNTVLHDEFMQPGAELKNILENFVHKGTGCTETLEAIDCRAIDQGSDIINGWIADDLSVATELSDGRLQVGVNKYRLPDPAKCEGLGASAKELCLGWYDGAGKTYDGQPIGDTWASPNVLFENTLPFRFCMVPDLEGDYAGRKLYLNEDAACDSRDQSCNFKLLDVCERPLVQGESFVDMCFHPVCVDVNTLDFEPAAEDIAVTRESSLSDNEVRATCINFELGASTCGLNELNSIRSRSQFVSQMASSFSNLPPADSTIREHAMRSGFRQFRESGCVTVSCDSRTNIALNDTQLPRALDHTCCTVGPSCYTGTCHADLTDATDKGYCNIQADHTICDNSDSPCDPQGVCAYFTTTYEAGEAEVVVNPLADPTTGCVRSAPLCLNYLPPGAKPDSTPAPLEGYETAVPGFLRPGLFCAKTQCNADKEIGGKPVVFANGKINPDYIALSFDDKRALLCDTNEFGTCEDARTADPSEKQCAIGCCQDSQCHQLPVDQICQATNPDEVCGCSIPGFFWRECLHCDPGDDLCFETMCNHGASDPFVGGANPFFVEDTTRVSETVVNDEVGDILSSLASARGQRPHIGFVVSEDNGDAYIVFSFDHEEVDGERFGFELDFYDASPALAAENPEIYVCGGDITCTGSLGQGQTLSVKFDGYVGDLMAGGMIGPLNSQVLFYGSGGSTDVVSFKVGIQHFSLNDVNGTSPVDEIHGGRVQDKEGVFRIHSSMATDEEPFASAPWDFNGGEVIQFESRCVEHKCMNPNAGGVTRARFTADDFNLDSRPTIRSAMKKRKALPVKVARPHGIDASIVHASTRAHRDEAIYVTDPTVTSTSHTTNILFVVFGSLAVIILAIVVSVIAKQCISAQNKPSREDDEEDLYA